MSNRRLFVPASVLVALVILLVLSGCGGSSKNTPPKETARPLTSAEIPTEAGFTRGYLSNDPNVGGFIGVDFDFKGPWDFREGPIDSLLETKIVPKTTAVENGKFPAANVAMERVIKGTSSKPTFAYFGKTADAYVSYGQALAKGKADVLRTPERLLVFPVTMGKSWKDKITMSGKPPITLSIERKVVGIGTIILPAGTFKNTAMVQAKKTLRESDGTSITSMEYEWYAPNVGIVALISGRTQEPEPLFKEASFFERLRSYTK